MKNRYFPAIVLLLLVISGFTASVIWNVSENGVTINFELPNEGTKGTVSGLVANIDFDEKDPSAARVHASVNMNTFNTGNQLKDKHLMSSDFFDVEKYPTATFTSTSIKTTKEGFLAIGDLTIKNSTRSVQVPFTFNQTSGELGVFKGTMTIYSSEFGIMKKSKSGKDKVVIMLTIPVKR